MIVNFEVMTVLLVLLVIVVSIIGGITIGYVLDKDLKTGSKAEKGRVVIACIFIICILMVWLSLLTTLVEDVRLNKEILGKQVIEVTEITTDYVAIGTGTKLVKLYKDQINVVESDTTRVEVLDLSYHNKWLNGLFYIKRHCDDYTVYLDKEMYNTFMNSTDVLYSVN